MKTFKKFMIITIFLIITSLTFLYFEKQKHVFFSPLYTEYKHKIKDFLVNHSSYKKAKNAPKTEYNNRVNALLKQFEVEEINNANFHESFLQNLRDTIAISNDLKFEEHVSKNLIDDLVNWLFLKVDLNLEMQTFFYTYSKPFAATDFFSYLLQTTKELHDNPSFAGIGVKPLHEDQFLQGNIPSFVANITEKTKLIRFGQPVFTLMWMSFPKISPEFIHFLQNQNAHLYVNLMKRKGVEGSITNVLENLENRCENFFIITLDKDSSFYWQNDQEYPELIEAVKFKQQFLDHMNQQKGNYYWSKHLLPFEWKNELSRLLDEVHASPFHNQTFLNRKERQDFIEIAYLAILDKLVDKWPISSMNITCRQGMDRGPSLMVLWMLKKGISSKEELCGLLLSPPLIIHNRASHLSRIERFISAGQRIQGF